MDRLGGGIVQFGCLDLLWIRESNWNPASRNTITGASGIGQFLPAIWAHYGGPTRDPFRQVDAGLSYIAHRYGTPCGALRHSRATGWY